MENSLKNIIDDSKSVMILLPTKPFFDQVAAGLSLFLALRSQKDVQITAPSPMVVEFNRLVGVNKITQEMGNKNLVIEFSDYKASDIERVSYDIVDGKFRLTVIPKPNVSAPEKGQIQLNYSGVSSDTVILVGGANESHFPALASKDLAGAKVAHIGAKDLSLSQDKKVISLAKPASSVSEIIASYLIEGGYEIDEDTATNLLMGIEEASSNYTADQVSAETFEITANLLRLGGRRHAGRTHADASDFPKGSIPGQEPQRDATSVMQPQQDQSQQTQARPVDIQNQQVDRAENEDDQQPPQEWLKPKIYKGTTN